ncbi:MAG: hypothetical protein GC192_23970 [Bacteroidetes bacterium]|nr:hypothetical protein [Bacteroidota bacterium]
MKTSIFSNFGLILFTVLSLAACHNDDDATPSNNSNPTVITQGGGNWKVTYYWDKDKDETSNFSSYTFKFNADGSFESVGGSTTSGTWNVTDDDSSQRLNISSGSGSKPLTDLDDDWIIIIMDADKIQLKDDNSEHLEELHFEKL